MERTKIRTGHKQLQDMCSDLEKVSSLKDTGFPIVSPTNIRLEPGEKMIVDLLIEIQWPNAPDEPDWYHSTDKKGGQLPHSPSVA